MSLILPTLPPSLDPRPPIRSLKLSEHLLSNSHSNDIYFHFSNTSKKLFAFSSLLLDSSYFSNLLNSDFAESQKSTLAEYLASRVDENADGAANSRKRKAHHLEDGDSDEDDEEVVGENANAVTDGEYHHIQVTETSYKTYRAVLIWIYTSIMNFSPLQSTLLFPFPPTSSSRAPSTTPSPSPVSPKSVFRLSHFLDLPQLSQLALDNFKSPLTVENVAVELYSQMDDEYSDVLEICLEFTAKNWTKVKVSKAMKLLEMEWDQGLRVEYPRISRALSRRLS